jgi:hypothetical protein
MRLTMPKHHRGCVARFVEEVQARGRLTFALTEIKACRTDQGCGLEAALRRHAATGAIRRVTPERAASSLSCPPNSTPWAHPHGSSHFAVIESQVMVVRRLKPIEVGRTRIRFFLKAGVEATPTGGRKNPWGR